MDLNTQILELVPKLEALAQFLFSKDAEFKDRILNNGCHGDYICTYIGGGRLQTSGKIFEPGLYLYSNDPSDGYSISSSEKITSENPNKLHEIFDEYPRDSHNMKIDFISAARHLLDTQ